MARGREERGRAKEGGRRGEKERREREERKERGEQKERKGKGERRQSNASITVTNIPHTYTHSSIFFPLGMDEGATTTQFSHRNFTVRYAEVFQNRGNKQNTNSHTGLFITNHIKKKYV